jgi:hypothetical protein
MMVVVIAYLGIPVVNGLQWTQTDCTLAACTCIERICGTVCSDRTNCNITVRVGWAGTDANGAILTSSSKFEVWLLHKRL